MSRIAQALQALNEKIADGGEFPDAAWSTAQKFKVNQSTLESMYDQQSAPNWVKE